MIKTHVHFFIDNGDGLTGEAMLYPLPTKYAHLPRAMRSYTPWLYFHRLWVRAKDRNRGVGKSLLEKVCRHASTTGTTLVLRVRPFGRAVDPQQKELERVYRRYGFRRVGKRMLAGRNIMVRIPQAGIPV